MAIGQYLWFFSFFKLEVLVGKKSDVELDSERRFLGKQRMFP